MCCHGCWKGGEMSPKELIERCNDIESRLLYPAYEEDDKDALTDLRALDEIIEIVEMREPLKPMQAEMDTDGSTTIPCGYCGEKLRVIYDYCPWCGQKIDWSK